MPEHVIGRRNAEGHTYHHHDGRGGVVCYCGVCNGTMLQCSHCGGFNIDPGFTGLHQCNDCDGLFRTEDVRAAQIATAIHGLAHTEEELDS